MQLVRSSCGTYSSSRNKTAPVDLASNAAGSVGCLHQLMFNRMSRTSTRHTNMYHLTFGSILSSKVAHPVPEPTALRKT